MRLITPEKYQDLTAGPIAVCADTTKLFTTPHCIAEYASSGGSLVTVHNSGLYGLEDGQDPPLDHSGRGVMTEITEALDPRVFRASGIVVGSIIDWNSQIVLDGVFLEGKDIAVLHPDSLDITRVLPLPPAVTITYL